MPALPDDVGADARSDAGSDVRPRSVEAALLPSSRHVTGLVAAVACAASLLVLCRWHSPENFFWFNARSIPWSYLWTFALLAAVLFAVTAFLLRGAVAALAWVGGALLALSAVGLLEAFWFAFQVLQGEGAGQVLELARGYVVVVALALVLTGTATALSRRKP